MRRNKGVSRREFITRSGLVLGAAVAGASGMGLVGFSQQPQTPGWPWPYKEIDPEKAAQVAYDGYIGGHN